MNKVIQTVTLGKDPELKQYGDGKQMVTFSGAVQKRYVKEGEESADWFNYVAFGKTAEFISKYFKKGSKMLITGEVNNNNYEKDGVKHYGCKINVDTVEFFGSKPANGEASEATTAKAEAPAEAAPAGDTGTYLDF